MAEIKIYKGKQIERIASRAEEFYNNRGYTDEWGSVCQAIRGSRIVGLAFMKDVIVGAGKVIGDGARFSIIVDLIVQKANRNKGIGTQLVQALALACDTSNVKLYTDPNNPGLSDFYKKAGFELVEGQYAFRWKR